VWLFLKNSFLLLFLGGGYESWSAHQKSQLFLEGIYDNIVIGKSLKHCLLELMTFHWPLLFVCLLNYLHACQRTFRIYKNNPFWRFSGCGTSPSLLRFCGTLGLSTWACTIPLRQHIPFILSFCFEPSFVVPPSDSDRQRRVLGIQSLVL
jgi:hypothetical protein